MGKGADALNRQTRPTGVLGREETLSPIPSDPVPSTGRSLDGATRVCGHCGAINAASARYCGGCGRSATQATTPIQYRDVAPSRSAGSAGRADTAGDTSTDDMGAKRAHIEDLRRHMGETIDEIQERLSPGHIVGEAKSAVRDATIGRAQDALSNAGGAGSKMIGTVRQNPIPAAMVAAGLGWLFVISRRNSSSTGSGPVWQTQNAAAGVASQVQDRTAQVAGQAQQTVSNLAGQVQGTLSDTAGQIQDTASQLTGQVQDQVTQLGSAAQQQVQQAQSGFQRMLNEQPLAVGAAAIALGIAAGLAVPETQKEHELMGPAKDAVMEQAQAKAQDAAEKVQTVAQEAIGAAKDAAQQEAAEQGLTKQ